MSESSTPEFARVLVTGASSGIGREVAIQLAAAGYRLFLTGRSQERLDAVAEECGGDTPRKRADLISPGAAGEVVEACVENLGGLDAVVHCAGTGLIASVPDTTDAEFVRVTNTNIRGTFLTAQAACAKMAPEKKGRFLTIPGILGKAPMKNASAYVASKYAVTGLIRSMALEYQRHGIQFCLFHFGGVDSPFWDDLDMKVQREKMIPAATAAEAIVRALGAPSHLVTTDVTIQPESHQM